MRSTRRDLEDVVAKFEGWRATRQGRAIPDELWGAAIRLLDGHTASAVYQALGLSCGSTDARRAGWCYPAPCGGRRAARAADSNPRPARAPGRDGSRPRRRRRMPTTWRARPGR